MDIKKSKKFLCVLASIYWLMVILIFVIARSKFNVCIPHTYINIYWLTVFGIFLIVFLYTLWGIRRGLKGKNNFVVSFLTLYSKYSFLLKQLVNRDFKVKYKRSVLGVFWSFLNPLLIMGVQYIVFSTIFKSSTENYPVYLLVGTVFYNFFSEAAGLGLSSITGNASLIKKVYMPKYIYPLARLLSSLINLALSFIPLIIVMIITGTPWTWNLLLLIFDIFCLLVFTFGIVLILSTLMTFFQDTQFLWSVVSMVWMYLTPIFYTEDIIPSQFQTLYHMNPLYQYIQFARVCIIAGQTPDAMQYVYCLLSAFVVLFIGLFVFKKKQDKFVLYL